MANFMEFKTAADGSILINVDSIGYVQPADQDHTIINGNYLKQGTDVPVSWTVKGNYVDTKKRLTGH